MKELSVAKKEREEDIAKLVRARKICDELVELLETAVYPIDNDTLWEASPTEILGILFDAIDGTYCLDDAGHEKLGHLLETLSVCDKLDFVDHWKIYLRDFLCQNDADYPKMDRRAYERFADLLTRFKKEFEEIEEDRHAEVDKAREEEDRASVQSRRGKGRRVSGQGTNGHR